MTTPDENYTTTPPAAGHHISGQAAADFLQDVRQLVAFHQAIGIEGYPSTPELARFMEGQQQAAAPAPPKAAAPAKLKTSPRPSAKQQTQAIADPGTSLSELYTHIEACQRCSRRQSRNKLSTDAGKAGVKLLIISDAPSAEDDQTGIPMSGEPGQLLDKMLAAIGLSRAEVHLSLLTRCHAAEPPTPEAVDACLPFLLKEIILVAPKIICTMGPLSSQKLLHTSKPLSQLRGRFHEFQGIPLIPTFSPEFLLKTPEMKKATWLDLQLIQKKLQTG